jgi:type I restriction enzyme, S subunit
MRSTPLGSVCEIEMGQAPKGSSYNDSGDGYPLLAGAGDFGDDLPAASKFTTEPTKLSKRNDILLCIRATIGDLNWSDREYCLGRGVAGLRPKNGELDRRYLWQWLSFVKPELEKRARGSTFKQVSRKDIFDLEILLPSTIDEQRRIAAILDKSDGVRRKREQIIAKADEFLKSVFVDMFGDLELNTKGWDTQFLRDILETDPQNGLYKPAQDYGAGTLILRIDSFYDGYLVSEKPLKRLRIDEKTVTKYRLVNGDVVINRVNSREYLGKSALIEGLEEDTVFESNMMRFRADDAKVNSRFLVDQLQTQYIRRQILRASKDAVNQSSINQTDVNNFDIRVPPLKLQQLYADAVAIKKRNDLTLDLARVEADHLFSSLSQRAFRGEL